MSDEAIRKIILDFLEADEARNLMLYQAHELTPWTIGEKVISTIPDDVWERFEAGAEYEGDVGPDAAWPALLELIDDVIIDVEWRRANE